MIGDKKSGFPEQKVVFLHCIIHQEALCKKVLNLGHVIAVVTGVVNFIRGSKLRHRKFKKLLLDENSEFPDVHHHIPIRWLSVGQVCDRVYKLRSHIIEFLNENKNTNFEEFKDENWLNHLAFTVDLLKHLNDLNKKLQGKKKFVLI